MALFDEEVALYNSKLAGWLPERQGQWVAIHGQEVLGFYGLSIDAFQELIPKMGSDRFFLRQIQPNEASISHPVCLSNQGES